MPPRTTKKSLSSERKCVFCNLSEDNELKYGKIYERDGIVTHYYCLLLSSNMQQRGRDEDGILGFLTIDIEKELKRGRRLVCSYCKKTGATLGCCNRKCKKVFHYPCGIKDNTLHQFYDQYKSFCVLHRPKQNIDAQTNSESPEHPICYICYDTVNRENIYQTLWAPCCKKNAWFHRDCVQQLALSAGYFFKCPLCNNKKAFQNAMLESGIFVPSQDASWELVPNAFQELLYRHNKCDAKKCLCPNGREYTSSNARWELVLCRTCGSQGIHMECGNLRWINPTWDCDECSAILNRNGTYQNSNHNRTLINDEISTQIFNEGSSETDDDSSDSDISVGTEKPITEENSLNEKAIVLRPGPRSAKLKQLEQHIKTNTIQKSIAETSLAELTNILNDQQAHHSFPDEISSHNLIESTSSINIEAKITDDDSSSKVQSNIEEDVILLDSDDDNEIKEQTISSMNNKMPLSNDNTDCTISYMNIKISDVTSLPAEVFASVPETSLPYDTSLIQPQTNTSTYLMKRKADSSDVVSMIVKRINDSIDSPESTVKKTKMDNIYNIPVSSTPKLPPVQSTSVLRGVTGSSYRNGVSLAKAAIVAFNGKEFVVPLDTSAPTPTSSITIPTQQNVSKYPGGRCCADNGVGKSSKARSSNNNACSSRNTHTRIDRTRLMQKNVLLRDLKFRVCSNNTITIMYRDNLTMNIAVDAKKERKTVNNYSFNCTKDDSKRTSRVRGLNPQNCNTKTTDGLCHVKNIESLVSSKCDRASDVGDTCLLPKDSTHFLANGNLNNLCKYQQKEAAKENLVPDVFDQSNNVNADKLSSPERINRRFRYEKHNENNIVTSRKFNNYMSVTSNPGTSRDELRKLSHSNVNQRHFTTSSNIISKGNRKMMNRRRKSVSSYFNQKDLRCHVSIDLNRIQSIVDKIPNLELKKNNHMKDENIDDIKLCSLLAMNEHKPFKSLRRCKSESNISSLCNNNLSWNCNNYLLEIDLIDLQKRKKAKRKKRIDNKRDCVR
ncbi:hypothetical protein PV325_012076 [Microctonus aethiopoides]|nr:hypothetical protein PV325_012076 [Microctonus aethiopoides]